MRNSHPEEVVPFSLGHESSMEGCCFNDFTGLVGLHMSRSCPGAYSLSTPGLPGPTVYVYCGLADWIHTRALPALKGAILYLVLVAWVGSLLDPSCHGRGRNC